MSARLPHSLGRRLAHGSTDKAEVSKFANLASSWWKHDGPMRPLHMMNPCRVRFIVNCLQSAQSPHPLDGIQILDVGCGAGLLTESLGRLGARVTGLDASQQVIHAAVDHARHDPVLQRNVEYRHGIVESLVSDDQRRYNVVTCLEVIEHVRNPHEFVHSLRSLLQDDGHLFISTINRTAKSYILSIVGAEYIARILPIGTHDWRKFITPSELEQMMKSADLSISNQAGIVFDILKREFLISASDLDNNYIVHCRSRQI